MNLQGVLIRSPQEILREIEARSGKPPGAGHPVTIGHHDFAGTKDKMSVTDPPERLDYDRWIGGMIRFRNKLAGG